MGFRPHREPHTIGSSGMISDGYSIQSRSSRFPIFKTCLAERLSLIGIAPLWLLTNHTIGKNLWSANRVEGWLGGWLKATEYQNNSIITEWDTTRQIIASVVRLPNLYLEIKARFTSEHRWHSIILLLLYARASVTVDVPCGRTKLGVSPLQQGLETSS